MLQNVTFARCELLPAPRIARVPARARFALSARMPTRIITCTLMLMIHDGWGDLGI
jgi:hypothetical protein